jgi:hypothetical protein
VFVAHGRRQLRIGLAAGGTAACLALLAACGGGGSAPQTLPRLSTTPAAETSTAPLAGEAAELAAATTTVRMYFELKNRLPQDMDARSIAQITTPTCACREIVRTVRALRERHQHYFGAARVRGMTPAADSSTLVEVLVTYDSTAGGTADSHNRTIYRGQAHRDVTQMFYVREIDGHWLIDQIRLIDAGHVA